MADILRKIPLVKELSSKLVFLNDLHCIPFEIIILIPFCGRFPCILGRLLYPSRSRSHQLLPSSAIRQDCIYKGTVRMRHEDGVRATARYDPLAIEQISQGVRMVQSVMAGFRKISVSPVDTLEGLRLTGGGYCFDAQGRPVAQFPMLRYWEMVEKVSPNQCPELADPCRRPSIHAIWRSSVCRQVCEAWVSYLFRVWSTAVSVN